MNKLLTLGLVCAVTVAVLWRQRNAVAATRAEGRRWAAEAEVVAASFEHAQREGAQLEAELAEELAKAKALRQDLAAWDAHAQPAVEVPRSLGPGQCWPASEPWCYLPKATLTRLGFMTFNQDGRLTDSAALLFGMSRAERAHIEDAYATLSQELQALDLAHLRPVKTPDFYLRIHPEYQMQSYGLEVPPEQAAAWKEQFNAAVREVLPGEQGELFLQVNQRFFDAWFQELSSSSIRLTAYTPTNAPGKGYEHLLAEYAVPNLEGDQVSNSKFLYPEDETALGFQRFATLLRKHARQSGPQR